MLNRITPKIIIALIIITLLSFGISAVLFYNGSLSSGINNYLNFRHEIMQDPEGTIDEKLTFPAENIKYIVVRTVSTDVKFINAETGEINVNLSGDTLYDQNQNPYVTLVGEIQNDTTLYLEVRHRPGLNLRSSNLNLDIGLPGEYSHNISVSTVSGSLNVSELELESFDYKSISGNMKAEKLIADKITLNFTSGTADINEMNGDLIFESVSGNFRAAYKTLASNIEARTTSGDIELYLPQDASFRLLFQTVSGEVKTAFPGTMVSSSRQKFEELVGQGDNKINIHTVSGNVQLKK
ncbi:hypothetical protein ASZ90_018282 [hydrocarbon metagenome]|uniref:DUF4097 domain-containing protein n=1 Tax=hydrocarbon metagenome TaxID=938273 RepID=A0A0W8E770_9ZZZZ